MLLRFENMRIFKYLDPPSGMEKPNIDETTETSVTLSWEPPRKGPVTGYIVEKRPKGERNWSKYDIALHNFSAIFVEWCI